MNKPVAPPKPEPITRAAIIAALNAFIALMHNPTENQPR
jgi:hypothetical protein